MTTVQWIIISYLGTSTGLQLVFGRLADAHGLKRFYLIGIAIYTLAVLLISLATTFEWVLVWRVLQAIGYAMVVTTVPALVTRLFPEEERGRALGSMMSVGTLGMITATLGGGFLVDAFGWDSIFLFRVPLGLIAFFLAYAVLQEAVSDEKQGRLDLGGIIALFVALVALVLFLNLGGRFGWAKYHSAQPGRPHAGRRHLVCADRDALKRTDHCAGCLLRSSQQSVDRRVSDVDGDVREPVHPAVLRF